MIMFIISATTSLIPLLSIRFPCTHTCAVVSIAKTVKKNSYPQSNIFTIKVIFNWKRN